MLDEARRRLRADEAESFFGPVCSPIIEVEGSFTSNHVTVIGTAFAAQSEVVLLC